MDWQASRVRRPVGGHFYGYERDLHGQKQTREQRADKDEYATVDLTHADFSPIVGWAQLNNIFKCGSSGKDSAE